MPDEPTQQAIDILRNLPDDAPFALYATTTDGQLQGRTKYGQGDPGRLAELQFALLGAHIRGVVDAIDQDYAPNQVAQQALRKLHQMETQGKGITREQSYGGGSDAGP